MDKENKYLIQSNYFTQAVFNLEKETYKDIVYFIQSKINFYGDPIKTITFTIEEYAKFKGIEANNIYSIEEFLEIFKDLINVHGAFFNNLTNQVTMFNLIQDASIDQESNYRITVTLSDWSEKFFFKDAMHKYVEGILKTNELNKGLGHTQIDRNVVKIKGIKRKLLYDMLSQFKSTGFCKISLFDFKKRLGYIKMVEKDTGIEIDENIFHNFFIPTPKRDIELIDTMPNFANLERYFLKGAIKYLNESKQVDINNIKINKIKQSNKITHLEFTYNALGHKLTLEEIECQKLYLELGLDEYQTIQMLKRIGYKEMYGRYMKNIRKSIENNEIKYFDRNSEKEINNLGGFCYKILLPELMNVNKV